MDKNKQNKVEENKVEQNMTDQQYIDKATYIVENWSKFAHEFAVGYAPHLHENLLLSKGLYQPTIGENYTQNVNISPSVPSQDDLKTWLENPAAHATNLRSVSQYLENTINQYKRTMDHFAKILLFRYSMNGLSVPKTPEQKETWKNGYNRCLEWLKKFNLPYQTVKVMQKTLSEGGFFGYLREGSDFNSLIEIPSDYCYITGRWDLGWTWAIDLSWFDKVLGMENAVPEIYREYEILIEMRKRGLKGDDLAPYQYYAVPVTKGFVFAFDMLRAQVTPPLCGTFRDALSILEYKDLLKQKTQLDTWKMVAQVIPRDKDGKPMMSAKSAKEIVAAVQNVMPSGTITFCTPFDPKEINFNNSQNQNNISGLGESLYWKSTGVNGVIMDAGDKTQAAVSASLRNDFGFVVHLYRQWENFINLHLMLKSRQQQFRVSLYGNRYTENEDTDKYMEACSRLNFPVNRLFGWFGIQPYEIDGMLYMEKEQGWKDKLEPILSAFNTKDIGSSEKGGTPTKKEGQTTDGGEQSKDYDSNKTSGKGDI